MTAATMRQGAHFDRRTGAGESIEFILAGAPLVGGEEDVAAELSRLIKNAHSEG
jgi:hypothetical protein